MRGSFHLEKSAFSRGEVTSKNLPWLSLIVPSHAAMIRNELVAMKAEGFVPAPLRDYVTSEEAIKRYDASIKWIDTHKHAIIGNGPFYLDSYNPEGRVITLKAFRDSSYPFEQGHWSQYQTPKVALIDSVAAPRTIIAGKSPLKADVAVSIGGKPARKCLCLLLYFRQGWKNCNFRQYYSFKRAVESIQ